MALDRDALIKMLKEKQLESPQHRSLGGGRGGGFKKTDHDTPAELLWLFRENRNLEKDPVKRPKLLPSTVSRTPRTRLSGTPFNSKTQAAEFWTYWRYRNFRQCRNCGSYETWRRINPDPTDSVFYWCYVCGAKNDQVVGEVEMGESVDGDFVAPCRKCGCSMYAHALVDLGVVRRTKNGLVPATANNGPCSCGECDGYLSDAGKRPIAVVCCECGLPLGISETHRVAVKDDGGVVQIDPLTGYPEFRCRECNDKKEFYVSHPEMMERRNRKK